MYLPAVRINMNKENIFLRTPNPFTVVRLAGAVNICECCYCIFLVIHARVTLRVNKCNKIWNTIYELTVHLVILYMKSPFRSKLNPYFQLIRAMRKSRKTWQEISDEIASKGTKTCPSGVYDYYKRHCRRPVPLGWDEEYPATQSTQSTGKKPFSYDPKADKDLIQ